MAWYDNRHWLLSHVRNSFISTDDTGMCELVMVAEDLPRLLRSSGCSAPQTPDDDHSERVVSEWDCYPEMEGSDDEDNADPLAESYDLQHDMDFSIHRQRSNTAQRLEKMEHAQKKAAKIKVIKWEGPFGASTQQERDLLFPKKNAEEIRNRSKAPVRSLLSDRLEKCTHLPQTRYLEFAMFDGGAQFSLPTKVYKIFMTMLPEELRNYPITICIVANAKIRDLIGLTCYKYSVAHPEVALAAVTCYGLYICEDDGEVDFDFPCLDANEPCSKFGFTCLGLVDSKSNSLPRQADIQTCSIPEKGGFNAIAISETSKPETNAQNRPTAYEPPKDSSKNLDKNMPSRTVNRTNSNVTFKEGVETEPWYYQQRSFKGGGDSSNASSAGKGHQSQDSEALNRMKAHESLMEAPVYKSYRVQIINKVRSNTDIFLGISGEKIEMDPIKNNFNFWRHMKRVSYNIDCIALCEIVEAKSSRTTFRLYYSPVRNNADSVTGPQFSTTQSSGSAFKHFNFECDHATAKEITEKINMIIKLKSSTCRKEFMALRDRKSNAKKSFL